MHTETGKWLKENLKPLANRIDREGYYPIEVMRGLGSAGRYRWFENGIDLYSAIETAEEAGSICGSTAFTLWCHQSCLWYLLNTENEFLRSEFLEKVTGGSVMAATALSNPMKHYSDIEDLKLRADRKPDGSYIINGTLPWISNLTDGGIFGFIFRINGTSETVMGLAEVDREELKLKPAGPFSGMEGTATYALQFRNYRLSAGYVLSEDAEGFVKKVRAGFILLQLGIAFGVTRGALEDMYKADRLYEENRYLKPSPRYFEAKLARLREKAIELSSDPLNPSNDYFRDVLKLRLDAAILCRKAANQAVLRCGARGYLLSCSPQRRLREAMFVSIVTPAEKHLRKELQRNGQIDSKAAVAGPA